MGGTVTDRVGWVGVMELGGREEERGRECACDGDKGRLSDGEEEKNTHTGEAK